MKINDIPDVFSVALRIKVIACLVGSSKTFNELLELTQATRGNLSVQLTKLEEWGFIISAKVIEKKRTKSTYTLTSYGLNQFEEYISTLQSVLVPRNNNDVSQ